MDTVGDLVERARERDAVAYDAPGRTTGYSYREFATDAWKAANLLAHYGVHAGATVAVVVGPKAPESADRPGRLGAAPDPLFAVLGATLLGAALDLDPADSVEMSALVAPADWLDRYDAGAGCTRLAYGGPPEAPGVVHFEQARWSQNPVAPPDRVTGDAVVFPAAGLTQSGLLDRARAAVRDGPIEAGDRVGLDGPLTAETLAPAVLAPLAAGATIVGGDPDAVDVRVAADGTVAVSD